MIAAGFHRVPSYNPYWEAQGQTFEDLDGYRVVLQNAAWTHSITPSEMHRLDVPNPPILPVDVCCSCAHVVEGDLGEMPLNIVCEHIAQYQIGHLFGGKRF